MTTRAAPVGTPGGGALLRVLVPVDGSAGSNRAVAYVIDLARCVRAVEVHIANVQPPLTYIETLVSPAQMLADYWGNTAGREAVRSACSLLESAGVAHAVHLEHGELAETIETIARRHECDLIVMGTRGMGAVSNLVIGSVASGVIHCADRPVTLVK